MRSLSLSGAGTKIAALAGAAIKLIRDKKYRPEIISGISSGGILTVPLALGLFDELEFLVKNFNLDTIFNVKPVNSKGKIRFCAILRLLFGKHSLGEQKNLIANIAELVTRERFEEYKSGKYADCIVGTVEYGTGKMIYVNLKEKSYEEFLQYVNASTSIPVFVESQEMRFGHCFDGAVRDFIPSHYVIENYNVTENVSIYSRPKDYRVIVKDWKPSNVYKVLERTVEIMQIEISKNDEFKEETVAKSKNVKNTKIFMPHILSSHSYQFSKKLVEKWYEIGQGCID